MDKIKQTSAFSIGLTGHPFRHYTAKRVSLDSWLLRLVIPPR
jgi:hypothetical protein